MSISEYNALPLQQRARQRKGRRGPKHVQKVASRQQQHSVNKEFKFLYSGHIMGKPRMTRKDRWAQRPCVLRYWAFKDAIRNCFIANGGDPSRQAAEVSWLACIAMPHSWTKKKREQMDHQPHRQKPDRDNIDKAILDALFDEDKTISSGFTEKFWSKNSSLEVRILWI